MTIADASSRAPRACRAFAFAAIVGAGALAAPAARAQESVEELISAALAHRQAGRDAEAYPLLVRAYEADPTARAAGQLAMCEQALGKWVDAWRHFREALAARDDRWVTRTERVLRDGLAVVEEQVGTLEVLGGVEGARVELGGRAIATLPMRRPEPVLVGRAPLEVSAPGYITFSTELTIASGELTRQHVELERAAESDELDVAALDEPTPSRQSERVQRRAREPSDRDRTERRARPDADETVFDQGWFWATVAGVVAVGLIVGVAVASSGEEIPTGSIGNFEALAESRP